MSQPVGFKNDPRLGLRVREPMRTWLASRILSLEVLEDDVSVFWSFVYASFVALVELVVWMFRAEDAEEVEILVLRHELGVLRARSAAPHYGPPIGRCSPG